MSLLRRIRTSAVSLAALATLFAWLFAAALAGEVNYEYDDAGRLKRTHYTNTTRKTYSLDAAGNRTSVSTAPGNGRLQLALEQANATEGTTPFTINVTRTGATAGAVSVSYAAVALTASSPSDYTLSSGTLNWADGDGAAKPISVTIGNDSVFEGSETFRITLSNAGGGALIGSNSETLMTIIDNDVVTFSVANDSVGEGAGSKTITITKSGATTLPLSVSYATQNDTAIAGPPGDYLAASGTSTFEPGAVTKIFPVTITQDSVYEGNETFKVALSNQSAGTNVSSPATITIIEDDAQPPAGTFSFNTSTENIPEDLGTPQFRVWRLGGSFGAVSVVCSTSNGSAVNPADYTAVSHTLTWPHGDTAIKFCPVTIVNDTTYEGNETFTLSLTSPVGGTLGTPSATTVTILDNDPQPLPGTLQYVTTNWSIPESGGAFNIVLARVGTQGEFGPASIQCTTLGSTADFTDPAATLTWAAGEAGQKTCTIPIIQDTVYEAPSETFFVWLQNATGAAWDPANSPTFVTIVDDDPPPPAAPPAPTWPSWFQPCVTNTCEFVGAVTISWNAVSGATYYELEKSVFGLPWGVIYSGSATQVVDGDRSLSDSYRVRACNAGGCGVYSSTINLTMPWP